MQRSSNPVLVLKPGRERSLRLRHPWIFSGAVARVEGAPDAGATVEVVASDGERIARAAYSPASQIRARVWSFDPQVTIDEGWFTARVRAADEARPASLRRPSGGWRVVHGESDGLPGVVADRYDGTIVVQLGSAGAERWREAIIDALAALPGVRCVVERSDAEVRRLEGLAPRVGVARGSLADPLVFREHGIAYRVDPLQGQKTGFYLDQRDNRRCIARLAGEREVLNAFCYTGGFTLPALRAGARSVVSIDSSAEALAAARLNLALNPRLDAQRAQWIEADVFTELRRLRGAGASYDLIVLDPPKFAPTARHAERAARAYKDVNLLALRLLRPGGLLATFSCSGGIPADLFQKIVAGAAVDAHVSASIVARLGASADHPVALAFPEGDYLKGLLLRKA